MDPIHLSPEEQDYELNIRGVFNLSTSRQKTSCLREFLKREEGGEQTISQSRVEQLNPKTEMAFCVGILDSVITSMQQEDFNLDERTDCRSRLIHVINRIKRAKPPSPEDQTTVYAILDEAEARLANFQPPMSTAINSMLVPLQQSTNRSPLADVIEAIQNCQRGDTRMASQGIDECSSKAGQLKERPRMSSLNPSVLEFVPESLAAGGPEAIALSHNLARSEIQSWQRVEADNLNRRVATSHMNSQSGGAEQYQLENQLPNPFRSRMVGRAEGESSRDVRGSSIFGGQVDSFGVADRVGPISSAGQACPGPRPNRKAVPVHQWRLSYSGDGQGLHLYDFLSELRMFQRSEGVSDDELLPSVVHLLSGRARLWYRSWFDTFDNWDGLVAAMKAEFLPPKYDYKLLANISNRKQKASETFAEYLNLMLSLFRQLSIAVDDRHKLCIIEENMLPKYAIALSVIEINSIEQLSNVCRRVDFAYAKEPFSAPFNCVVDPRVPYRGNAQRSRDVHELDTVHPTHFYEHRGYNNGREATHGQFAPRSQDISTVQDRRQGQNNVSRVAFNSNGRDCFNCRRPGHSYSNCSVPRKGTFCYRCGTPNVTTFTCQNCHRKNEEVGSDRTVGAPDPPPT